MRLKDNLKEQREVAFWIHLMKAATEEKCREQGICAPFEGKVDS